MRIALVVTGGFDRSGRERVIPSLLWLVERLTRRHEVCVYVLRYHQAPCRYQLAGASVRDLGRPRGLVRQAAALSKAMREDGPFDVVHGYWAQPAGRLVPAVGARFGIPSVVTLDSGEFVWLPEIRYGLQSAIGNRFAVHVASRLSTRLTVCSQFQAGLARAHGVQANVIPLGVDTDVFTPRPPIRHEPPFRLLHVASLNPVKDQATLLRALHRVVAQGLDATLDVVGEDTMGGALARLARELGIGDRVSFHGFLATEQLVALYHAAHLFVLSSRHEAAGVVLLEAAACGVPIVGSSVGYLDDWAPDGATAVRPDDAGALASAIVQLLRDEPRLNATAATALAWARDHDATWTAQRFEALYRELVEANRGDGRPGRLVPLFKRPHR